jgi:hypothetical protein
MHEPDPRRVRGISLWAAAGVALLIAITSSARAHATSDLELQGRILQRSDGALFVYKDGFKFLVQVADLDDDAINAVPDGDTPVTQLDQLFIPPSLPPNAPSDVPAPGAPAPAPPAVVPGPYVAVANPVPGDTLRVGGLDIQGKAFDPAASPEQGSGIDRLEVFLEDRDRGGLFLGDARLGLPNTAAAPGSQFALAGWDVIVNLPAGFHSIFVYARSAVTGKETAVQVPVKVGGGP